MGWQQTGNVERRSRLGGGPQIAVVIDPGGPGKEPEAHRACRECPHAPLYHRCEFSFFAKNARSAVTVCAGASSATK